MAKDIIFIRGKPREIEVGKPVDVLIPEYNIIITDTQFERGVSIWSNVNIYGAYIGENTKIGAFVEIRKGVRIGKNVKIEPFVFIPEGVKIGDCVFIGPSVTFTNDLYPVSCTEEGELVTDYNIVETIVENRASIGAGVTVRCGVKIGKNALIGVGSVVVEDVPPYGVVYGEKARVRRYLESFDKEGRR
jgi:acetyltransferase-like isoleucine patch superfamily enzyme